MTQRWTIWCVRLRGVGVEEMGLRMVVLGASRASSGVWVLGGGELGIRRRGNRQRGKEGADVLLYSVF